jgi:DNA repair protein RecN (Recombination protein N)
MLVNLSIRNFGLIKHADLSLAQGLNVITGDTGSGKSMLIDSILFCFGLKLDNESSLINESDDLAVVSCEFEVLDEAKNVLHEILKEIDLELSDNSLIIKRKQSKTQKKRFFINDEVVTQKTAVNIFAKLIETSLQNSSIDLYNSSKYLDIIDSYSGTLSLRNKISLTYFDLQEINKQILDLEKNKFSIINELEFLKFGLNEILELNINAEELENLILKKQELNSLKKNKNLLGELKTVINELQDKFSYANKIAAKSGDSIFVEIQKYIEQSSININEAAVLMDSNLDDSEDSYISRLEEIEERIFAITDIARKHKIKPEEIKGYELSLKNKIDDLENKINNYEKLVEKKNILEGEYKKLAISASEIRKKSAEEIEKKISLEFEHLVMKNALFKISINSIDENFSKYGIDKISFLFTANPGSPLVELNKVASGGEMSRLMLALNVCILNKGEKRLMIFDEVDSGVSGVAANAVGERIKELSNCVQVITITHQPQVAGKADIHLFVKKNQMENETISEVISLDREGRILELARIISGKEVTQSSLDVAKQYLELR